MPSFEPLRFTPALSEVEGMRPFNSNLQFWWIW